MFKVGAQGETVYVNQFYVIRNGQVASKHIFGGSQRLVSKLASRPVDAPSITGGETTDPAAAEDPEPEPAAAGGNGNGKGKGNSKPKNPNAGGNGNGNGGGGSGGGNGNGGGNTGGGQPQEERDFYFYHPDHLGSSSYVTDIEGEVFQHTEYFPFGETWVEEHSNRQRTPYLFTGKELDEDTQLYYFGARYYDPRTSVWQSPDPILAEYLNKQVNGGVHNPMNLNLYGYSYQHPVNFSDPDGNSPISFGAKRAALASAKLAARQVIENRLTASMYRLAGSRVGRVAGRIGDQALTAVDMAFAAQSGAWWEIGLELIPVVGDVYSAGSLANKLPKLHNALQTIQRRADLAFDAIGNRGALRGALGLKNGDGLQAHHLIPIDTLDNPTVQKALDGGFRFNGAENGMAVVGQAGSHGVRTDNIRDQIDRWSQRNPDASPEQAADFLRGLASDQRADINLNGGFVTND